MSCLLHFVLNAYDKQSAPSLKGQFGLNGALYSGWETRRHNPTYDWCIIRLGTSGTIHGLDIDTVNFNGNMNQVLFRHDVSQIL
jgi:allantoicase